MSNPVTPDGFLLSDEVLEILDCFIHNDGRIYEEILNGIIVFDLQNADLNDGEVQSKLRYLADLVVFFKHLKTPTHHEK